MPTAPDLHFVPAWLQAVAAIIGFVVVAAVVIWGWIKPLRSSDAATKEMQIKGAAIVDSSMLKDLLIQVTELNERMREDAAERKLEESVEEAVNKRMRALLEKVEEKKGQQT